MTRPRLLSSGLLVLGAALLAAVPVVAFALQDAGADDAAVEDPVASARAAWDATPEALAAGLALQDALARAGRSDEAVDLFRQAQARARSSAVLAFLCGRATGGREGVQRMRAALERDPALDGVSASDLRAAWRAVRAAEVDLERWPEALSAALQVTSREPEAWDWSMLGWVAERCGDAAAALTSYRRALALAEKDVWTREALALLLAKQGQHREATTLARETVTLVPEQVGAHLHLGLVLCLAGDGTGGREAYAAALRLASGDADGLAAVAAAYLDVEEYDLAARAIDTALALAPDHGPALVTAGVLALERGDVPAARRHLELAVKARPADARVHYLLGVCYRRLAIDASAVNAFRRATELDSASVEYAKEYARALVRKGAVDTAIQALRRVAQICADDATVPLELGFLWIKKKRYRDAVAAFATAADLSPRDPRPWFYLAVVQGDHLGKPQDALAALRRYKELGGKDPAALTWLAQLEDDR